MFKKFGNMLVDAHLSEAQVVNKIDLLITKLEWLKLAINKNDRSMMHNVASSTSSLMREVLATCNIIKYFCRQREIYYGRY